MELRTVLVYTIVAIDMYSLVVVLWVNLYNRVCQLEVEVRTIITGLSKVESIR